MASIRFNFARALAAFLVAAMCVFTAQGAIAAVDRAQHGFGVAHAPSPVAGAVRWSNDHDHGHDVDIVGEHADDQASGSDDGPAGHHHSSEIPHAAAVSILRIAEIVPQGLRNDPAPRLDRPRLRLPARLERPPRTFPKTL